MAENSPGNFPQRTKTTGSMYGTFIYIWHTFMVNVGKSSIHGSYEKKRPSVHMFKGSISSTPAWGHVFIFHQQISGGSYQN